MELCKISRKALVLLSGGVDSATCLGVAVDDLGTENVATVSIFYGQRHDKELKCAEAVAKHYGVPHYVLDLSNILSYSNCSLLKSSDKDIPEGAYADQIDRAPNGMVATYVPFRNGLMLSAVASLAVSIFPTSDVDIYIGAHADDAAGNAYADCSSEFVYAMTEAIRIGTYGKVHVKSPLVDMNKAEVVRLGLSLHVPYALTWSCYEGGATPCGKCGTCIDRAAAFEANGIADPAMEVK